MPAHLKLTPRRQKKLLQIIELGLSFAAACRAVDVTAQAVRKRAACDPTFAAQLRAARAIGAAERGDPSDWRVAAGVLETEWPDAWALPEAG
jgi:hypothetical protein